MDQLLDDLAGAVLDGAPLDWAVTESTADVGARPMVQRLRLVASVAQVHRDTLPGDRWGHLRLLEQVGRGAFGDVYRAWDTRLDREVALKLLSAAPTSRHSSASTIIQEGRLLAKVRHPNVATIYGAEQIDDRIGLWMEFVHGRTLEELLKDGAIFGDAEVVRIGVDLCRAVSAVHAAGLVHRDIKAQNVTRADDGRVVLMDFGAGKELDDESSSDLVGTPLYVAPEVLAGGAATVRSDIYSLGVLLYHLLTRSYPVRARTIRDLRAAHERGERIDLRTERPKVRPKLARVIERAIDSDPQRRYESVDALERKLAALQPRSAITRIGYVAAAALIVLLVAGIAWNLRAPNPIDHPVIAVLPFKNVSGDPANVLLVDSVTARVIQQLALIDGLQVRSQTSSFQFKNKPRDLREVGRRMGVNLVIEGDSQISTGSLLIHASLVTVPSGMTVWSDKVDRPLKSEADVSAAIEELTRTIVNRLRLKLGPTQRRYDTDIPTLEIYLRARALRDARLGEAHKAIPLFQEVIRRDPSYAPAQAALAATYGYLALLYPSIGGEDLSPNEAVAVMEPLTQKALEIDPMLPEAHAALGHLHVFEGRWREAEAEFRRAIDLDPSVTTVYGDFALSTLQPWGRLNDAVTLLRSALQADPLSLDLRRVLGNIEISAGLFDDALEDCRRVMDEDPNYPRAEEICARALLFTGHPAEALALLNKRANLNEGFIGYVYAVTGRRDEAEKLAARNEALPQRQAMIYAGLGDKDRAFAALDRLAALNPRRAASYLTYPELTTLRGDPRVQTLRRKLGFPE